MINECPYFLVILTSNGITSQWVNQEIGYAVRMGREPIPVVEVNPYTGMRIESKGFVELHDPINYYRNDNVGLMASVVYTFYSLLLGQGKWRDIIFLSCKRGIESDAPLEFEKNWEIWLREPDRRPLQLGWACPQCQTI